MVHILEADYETIRAECPHCSTTSTFNRVSDIGDVGPYAGRNINCVVCGREFWVTADTAGAAYEMFIQGADDHFDRKRYMLSVASVAQAWELFFLAFAEGIFLYRPFFAAPPLDRSVDQLNGLAEDLNRAIQDFTFFPLRNLLIRVTIENVRPATLAESAIAVARIGPERFGNDVGTDRLAAYADPEVFPLLTRLLTLTVPHLRNRALHKQAYRPSRAETEVCLTEEVPLLFTLEQSLKVGTFDEYAGGLT